MAGELVALRKQDGSTLPTQPTDDLFDRLKRNYFDDLEKTRIWRKEAIEDFRFRDGDQWSTEDLAYLREQKRPVITFNRVGVLVDAVVGSEIGNRREVRAIPREEGDAKASEILTSAIEYIRDSTDAEDEDTEAFKDCVTAGIGVTEARFDMTDGEEGKAKIGRIDPFEMVFDRNAQKANFDDAVRFYRVRKAPAADAQDMHPDVELDELNAAWADIGEDDEADAKDRTDRYSDENRFGGTKDTLREVTLVEAQYVQTETYFKAALIPFEGAEPQLVELTPEKHDIALNAGAIASRQDGQPASVKLTRRTVMQCFLGASGVIGEPKPTQTDEFTWHFMTGLKDADRGIFYGIVRRAKDPQRWANKWLSQSLFIMNSQSKGGVMAEEGAFEDPRRAEEDWAKPDAIVKLAKGALSQGKIQPRPQGAFPAGFDRLMQVAFDMIVQATGINMELLGMRDANQPGVLEYQRRQSGISILATFFDGLRRYRKGQGRALITIIQRFLSDGRLIRIIGAEREQYVPLTKEAVADQEYDIIIDDSPTAPNEKERTWGVMQPMLPMLERVGAPPKMILAFLEQSPLPPSFVEKLKGIYEEQQQGGDPQQQAQQAAQQMEMAKLQLEQAKLQNDAEKIAADREKTQADTQIAYMNAETERQRIAAEHAVGIAQAMRPEPPRAQPN